MLLKMLRTQKTKLGTLRRGVVYTFDPAKPGHDAVAKSLLERKVAQKTTKAAMEKAAKERGAEAMAVALGEIAPQSASSEAAERGAVIAQEAGEAAAKDEATAAVKAAAKAGAAK